MGSPVRFMICLVAGSVLTAALFVCALSFPRAEHILDVVLEPAGWIIVHGPGGKEDPLLLLIALPAQIITYALLMYLPIGVVARMRRGPQNKNISILR